MFATMKPTLVGLKCVLDHAAQLLVSRRENYIFTDFTYSHHKIFMEHISILRCNRKCSELKMRFKHNLVPAMTALSNPEEFLAHNKLALRRLNRAIAFSQGQFSAVLVRCDDIRLRDKLVRQVQDQSSIEIQTLFLSPSASTLYTTVKTTLGDNQPQALMVLGLESVFAIEQVLVSTNLIRDEFRKQFHFPLVLWVNEEIMQKLIRLAPDFKNWAANAILFEAGNNQLVELSAITA